MILSATRVQFGARHHWRSVTRLDLAGLRNLLFHVNHTPALGGNSSIHGFAGRWWFELLAILAALVALRSVLVLHGLLRRLGLRHA